MFDKYEDLNIQAREYFILYLDENVKEKKVYERCKKEIELLYEKGILFIVEYLHKFSKESEYNQMCFKGMANNLLLLYILGLSKVDPRKYNLPYELFTARKFNIEFLHFNSMDFIEFVEKNSYELRIFKCNYEESSDKDLNKFNEDRYLFLPTDWRLPENMTFKLNEFNQFEIVEDCSRFNDDYIILKMTDKGLILEKEVDLHYALETDFEKELERIIKPVSFDDYVKIVSLAHGTHVWKFNQDELFKEKRINKDYLISNREDIYEYLINHSIDKEIAIDIVKFIVNRIIKNDNKLWKKYVDIMKENKCDDMFIEILFKINYIPGRGQAVSECLYALDENNYYTEDIK